MNPWVYFLKKDCISLLIDICVNIIKRFLINGQIAENFWWKYFHCHAADNVTVKRKRDKNSEAGQLKEIEDTLGLKVSSV